MACIENWFLLSDTFYSVISLNGICFRDILIVLWDNVLAEIHYINIINQILPNADTKEVKVDV